VGPTTLPDGLINTVDPDGVLDGTTEIDLNECGGMSNDENDFGYEEEAFETDPPKDTPTTPRPATKAPKIPIRPVPTQEPKSLPNDGTTSS